MANAHSNTKQTRLPIRTATAIEREAAERGITIANMADRIVMEWLEANKLHQVLDTLAVAIDNPRDDSWHDQAAQLITEVRAELRSHTKTLKAIADLPEPRRALPPWRREELLSQLK